MSTVRYLADEDVHGVIVRGVLHHEPSIEFETVVSLGLSGKSDPELLEYAHTNRWIMVTHDVNTMKPAAEARIRDGRGISGLMIVLQGRPIRPVIDSLIVIWATTQFEDWANKIEFLPL